MSITCNLLTRVHLFFVSRKDLINSPLDSEATQTLPVDTSLQAHSEPLKTSPTASPSMIICLLSEISHSSYLDGKDEERIEEEHDAHQEVNDPRPENSPLQSAQKAPVQSTEIEEEPPIQVISINLLN